MIANASGSTAPTKESDAPGAAWPAKSTSLARGTPTAGPADHARPVGRQPQLIPVLERIRGKRPGGGHPRTRPDHLAGAPPHQPSVAPAVLRVLALMKSSTAPADQEVALGTARTTARYGGRVPSGRGRARVALIERPLPELIQLPALNAY
jgi:hypothetical protein